MNCEHCGSENMQNAVFCDKCGKDLINNSINMTKISKDKSIKDEALKQLTGIKVVTILSIIVFSIYWLYWFSVSCEANYYDAIGFGLFLLYTIIFGGLIFLSSIGLVGLNKRRAYTIPVGRAILILFSFFIGFIPGGIIVLVLFWRRFKLPVVKEWLNYDR